MTKTLKQKKAFFCQNCGNESPKWLGKCPSCSEWNTFVEEIIQRDEFKKTSGTQQNTALTLEDISSATESRMVLRDEEFNRVLGGGIVEGSVILLSGEPGIGKSTLILQLVLQLSGKKTLYISGEESQHQIKLRSQRLSSSTLDNCFILAETIIQNMYPVLQEIQPDIVVVDSVQTLETLKIESPPGSVSQIKESVSELMKFAKQTRTPIIFIGHITKEGIIAGPKVLEHMVDVVLKIEGDRKHLYRILRAMKNRFGSTSEIGIYEMKHDGMHSVKNASTLLLNERNHALSGITVSVALEGYRALLVEAQALASKSPYGTPQRSTTGYDAKRLNILLAVIEKKAGLFLGNQDVFINIIGGIKIEDTALDMGVMAAILSSFYDKPIAQNVCFAGEIGLSGEVISIAGTESRILEAERMGFEKIFISKYGMSGIHNRDFKINIVSVGNVGELCRCLFH